MRHKSIHLVRRYFKCTECNCLLLASCKHRKKSKRTYRGHRKHMQCPRCDAKTLFIQCGDAQGTNTGR